MPVTQPNPSRAAVFSLDTCLNSYRTKPFISFSKKFLILATPANIKFIFRFYSFFLYYHTTPTLFQCHEPSKRRRVHSALLSISRLEETNRRAYTTLRTYDVMTIPGPGDTLRCGHGHSRHRIQGSRPLCFLRLTSPPTRTKHFVRVRCRPTFWVSFVMSLTTIRPHRPASHFPKHTAV